MSSVIVYLMFQFNAPLPHMVPESGEQCKLMSNTGLKPYFAYSDVVTAEDGTTWVSGPFAIAQRAPGATAWQPLALTGLQVQSIDMHPTNPGQLILGVEKPDMSIVVLDTTDRTQSRQYSLGTLLQDYDISLKAMQVLKPAAVAGASTVPCTTDFDIVLADAYGSLFTVAVPATAAQFAQCMRKRTGLSASADLPAVNVTLELKDVMPGPRVTAGLIDDPLYKQVSALYHDVESDHLFVLFSQSRTLRALNMATGNVTRYVPHNSGC